LAAKSVLLAAMKAGSRTDFIRLTDIALEPCRGCFRCLAAGKRCPIDDGLYELLGRIQEADALVLAAPVYFMAPPARVFSLLDRLLTVAGLTEKIRPPRRAVTLTIMGNRGWKGVAEPYVNLLASLLGFEIADSLSLVAEGPGQVLSDQAAVARLEGIGRAFAEGRDLEAGEKRPEACPMCRSDFFHVRSGSVVCPVCGLEGDLGTYVREGRFMRTGGNLRWGTPWLRAHIEAWIKPSLLRFKANRRELLSALGDFRSRYASEAERGSLDVQEDTRRL
jgi:multimeric flavodoxin WrbA